MNERAESDPMIGEPIFVRAASAEVTIGERTLRLTAREREVAIAVAVQTQPVSATALGTLLYPDGSDADASNVVKVYVCRLRKHVAADFIVCRGGGYVLGPRVRFDAAEARRLLAQLPLAPGPVDEAEREAHLELARGLRCAPPASLVCREWFEALPARLHRLGHDLAIEVGRNALEHGCVQDAIRVGRELTYEDPCDEVAWELLIRAQLNIGEHVAAVHGFRYYTSVLAKELDAAPSRSLSMLLADHVAS